MKNVVFHINNENIIVFLLLNTKSQIFIQTASDFHSKDSPKPHKRVAKRSFPVFLKIFSVAVCRIFIFIFIS